MTGDTEKADFFDGVRDMCGNFPALALIAPVIAGDINDGNMFHHLTSFRYIRATPEHISTVIWCNAAVEYCIAA